MDTFICMITTWILTGFYSFCLIELRIIPLSMLVHCVMSQVCPCVCMGCPFPFSMGFYLLSNSTAALSFPPQKIVVTNLHGCLLQPMKAYGTGCFSPALCCKLLSASKTGRKPQLVTCWSAILGKKSDSCMTEQGDIQECTTFMPVSKFLAFFCYRCASF